jgi:hypothetical protein
MTSFVAMVGLVVIGGVTVFLGVGPLAGIAVALIPTVLLCGVGLMYDGIRRRGLASAAERSLTHERHRVLRTVDLITDPELSERERLTVVDSFIPRLGRNAVPYRDRFVVVAELPAPACALLERARRSVNVVRRSLVAQRRLLDDVANEVLLPHQVWEIARLLRTQAELQAEQDRARQGVVTPELLAVLEPQQEALNRSVAAVTARVEGLERYARRVQEADAALKARDALDNNDKYRELLARTDDEEGMRALAAHGDALEQTLVRSVREAIEAGRTLAL